MNFIKQFAYKIVLRSYHRAYQASLDLGKSGQYDQALDAVRNALLILERVQPNHPGIGQCFQNMGTLHYAKKQFAEAEECYQRALPILEKHLGPEHRHTAKCINSLATLYRQMNRPREAQKYEQRFRKIAPRIHDHFPTHPPHE